MIIICEKCKSQYDFANEAATPSTFKVKCTVCGHVFTVHKPETIVQPVLLKEEAMVREGGKVIAVSNRKGGVAKTSTVLNLGASLAMAGKRVLLVDFDMQANLSIILGLTNREKSFYDLLHVPGNNLSEVIKKTKYKNLWILPANSKMALLAKKNITQKDFVHILRNKLDMVRKNIDFILIDTPPSIEFFTLNALVACDFVIIPTQCEYLSIHGVAHIEEAIRVIRKIKHKNLDYRILVTMAKLEQTGSRVIFKKIKEKYGDKVLNTHIDFDCKLQESQIMNSIIAQYDKDSPAARQYVALAQEITEILAPSPR